MTVRSSVTDAIEQALSKITPGPWRWGKGEHDFYETSLVTVNKSDKRAFDERPIERLVLRLQDPADNPADAEFVAQAPELLRQALEALRKQEQDVQTVAGFIVGWHPAYEDAISWGSDGARGNSKNNEVYQAAKRLLLPAVPS